jgi:hypothetical protein
MSTTIERDIRFYRVDAGNSSNGRPKPFNPTPVFEHIEKLKWTAKTNRYWEENGKVTGCWVYSTQMPCKVTLGTIRRTDLPQLETQGEVTPLEIPENSGLVEQTHIVFLNENTVGCDINYYGPRISRLPYYLAEKAVGIAPEVLNFNPILRRDVYKQLTKMKFLTMVKLKIRSNYVDQIAAADEYLGRAFDSAIRAGDADEVELVLQASKRRSKGWLSERILETTKRLGQNAADRYDISKFVVHGYNEEKQKSIELNLLSDKLIVRRAILRTGSRSRGLNATSAFNAIISAYEDLKEEIEASPSVEL